MYLSGGMKNVDHTSGLNRALYRTVSSLRHSLCWMKVVVWGIKKKDLEIEVPPCPHHHITDVLKIRVERLQMLFDDLTSASFELYWHLWYHTIRIIYSKATMWPWGKSSCRQRTIWLIFILFPTHRRWVTTTPVYTCMKLLPTLVWCISTSCLTYSERDLQAPVNS